MKEIFENGDDAVARSTKTHFDIQQLQRAWDQRVWDTPWGGALREVRQRRDHEDARRKDQSSKKRETEQRFACVKSRSQQASKT